MSTLVIHMFGSFTIFADNQVVDNFRSQRAVELFCYLMLYRDRPYHRDHLDELPCSAGNHLLVIDSDWLYINQDVNFWLDIREFLGLDRAHESTHQRLMRLFYLTGDWTAAICQFILVKMRLIKSKILDLGFQH